MLMQLSYNSIQLCAFTREMTRFTIIMTFGSCLAPLSWTSLHGISSSLEEKRPPHFPNHQLWEQPSSYQESCEFFPSAQPGQNLRCFGIFWRSVLSTSTSLILQQPRTSHKRCNHAFQKRSICSWSALLGSELRKVSHFRSGEQGRPVVCKFVKIELRIKRYFFTPLLFTHFSLLSFIPKAWSHVSDMIFYFFFKAPHMVFANGISSYR